MEVISGHLIYIYIPKEKDAQRLERNLLQRKKQSTVIFFCLAWSTVGRQGGAWKMRGFNSQKLGQPPKKRRITITVDCTVIHLLVFLQIIKKINRVCTYFCNNKFTEKHASVFHVECFHEGFTALWDIGLGQFNAVKYNLHFHCQATIRNRLSLIEYMGMGTKEPHSSKPCEFFFMAD